MALAKLNKAVSVALEETALATVDRLITAFKTKFEMDESDLNELANEIKEAIKQENKQAATSSKKASKGGKKSSDSGSDTEKPKRAPTAYNIFIKEKMAELSGADPSLKGKDLLKAAVEEWKKQKSPAE